jgi:capsular exopolysaccharide synthesis family protein
MHVSEMPDNRKPEERNTAEENLEAPPEPEEIWPPPQESKAPSVEPPAEKIASPEWEVEAEKIDEAIEEIRRINGVAGGPPVGEEVARRGAAGIRAEEIVAGKVGERPEPSVSGVTHTSYRVREQSEAELGQLWGNVFFSVERTPPRAIVVTGARRRDGATQIAIGLAFVGAQASRERRIALVDFNLRNPAIAEVLDIRSEPGLTDVLDGRVTLEAAMLTLRLPNGNHLFVLPSGLPADQPLGLIKSRQTQALITRLQERYDHTIIDVTTVNAYPDPQVIGALVDGAVLVTRVGETPRETVAEAKKRLDLAGVHCLGLALNQRSDPIPDFIYRVT